MSSRCAIALEGKGPLSAGSPNVDALDSMAWDYRDVSLAA